MHRFNRYPYLFNSCFLFSLLHTEPKLNANPANRKFLSLSIIFLFWAVFSFPARRHSREMTVINYLFCFSKTDDRKLNVILRVERVTTDWIAFGEHGYVEPRSALLCWYRGVEAAFFGSFICVLFAFCVLRISLLYHSPQYTTQYTKDIKADDGRRCMCIVWWLDIIRNGNWLTVCIKRMSLAVTQQFTRLPI